MWTLWGRSRTQGAAVCWKVQDRQPPLSQPRPEAVVLGLSLLMGQAHVIQPVRVKGEVANWELRFVSRPSGEGHTYQSAFSFFQAVTIMQPWVAISSLILLLTGKRLGGLVWKP